MNSIQQQEKQTDRYSRGLEIYNQGLVERIDDATFMVKGQYEVIDLSGTVLEKEGYICDCKDYRFNPSLLCKHCIAVSFYQTHLDTQDIYNPIH